MIGIIIAIDDDDKNVVYVAWCDLPPACEPSGRLQILRTRTHNLSELEPAYPKEKASWLNFPKRMKLYDFVVRRRP